MPDNLQLFKRLNDTVNFWVQQGAFEKALELVREYEKRYPSEPLFCFHKHGLFIDLGSDLNNETLIREGIICGEQLLLLPEHRTSAARIQYNLANGYDSLYKVTEYGHFAAILTSENLQRAKDLLRDALNRIPDDAESLKERILINLANCYDQLGRGVESIQIYEQVIAVNPKNPMAIGNRAQALVNFARISGEYREAICIECYQALQSILPDPGLMAIGGPVAVSGFSKLAKKIEALFENHPELLRQSVTHKPYDTTQLSEFERFYVSYCVNEELFLNFHIHQPQAEAATLDPIFISLVTPLKEKDRFYDLAKWINQIKQDFAAARFLLAQSQSTLIGYDSISERTIYVDSLDYARFDLGVGLLEAAFQLAANILDKIACFVNDYLHLGLPDDAIYFRSIWKVNGSLRDQVLATENLSLYALYDIQKDFESKYLSEIRRIRNALTHRKLVLYDFKPHDRDMSDSEIEYGMMVQRTNELMRLVRAAIIYLISFVNLEEEKKTWGGKETIPFPVWTM
jgi:hypothetical protein